MPTAAGPVRPRPGGVAVDVWVVPGSSRPGFAGVHDGAVRLRVAAPPEAGRANEETAGMVAEAIGGCNGRVVRGAGSRRKVVEVDGPDVAGALAGLRRAGVAL